MKYLHGDCPELDLLVVVQNPLFDVRYQSDDHNKSLLKYAIENNYYTLFEALLKLPYVLLRPAILEMIINHKDMAFVDILEKHSFNFSRYNFTYHFHSLSSSLRFPVSVFLIPKVTYADKNMSLKTNDTMRAIMQKKITIDTPPLFL